MNNLVAGVNDATSLREQALKLGAAALSDRELLAVLCGVEEPAELDKIGAQMAKAGGLGGFTSSKMDGLSGARRAKVIAALELNRRVAWEDLTANRQPLSNPRDSAAFLKARMGHLPYEVFGVLFLDNRHRVLAWEEMFRRTIDGASVHPREVVRACIEHNACAVVFSHGHPSGVAEPSAADRAITHELRDALQLIGVRVLDHLVIGAGEPVSMAARGLM
ncbi:MAG: DNA repair protein RadC [Rhodanobacter sp.]